MPIIDLNNALEKGNRSVGTVYISQVPQVRSGKRNDFMVGRFLNKDQDVEFKIWEEAIFSTVVENGPGLYHVDVEGSEFNGQQYLTVYRIEKEIDSSIDKREFIDSIGMDYLHQIYKEIKQDLQSLGASEKLWTLVRDVLEEDTIKNRFWNEGAAISHHDSIVGGLAHHTLKMLRFLVVAIKNNAYLRDYVDLLTFGIFVHDIGKVFEYDELEIAEFWYANHRVQGIEFLTKFKERIITEYDETFYRQVQSIISGHHGEYADRPSTIAAGIIHYIDTAESQITELIDLEKKSTDGRVYVRDWGYLAGMKY